MLSLFNKMQLKAPGSQQRTGHCMFCDIKITSTGATRFLEHLVKCSSVCAEVKARCKKLAQASQGKRKIKDEVASVTEDEVASKLAKVNEAGDEADGQTPDPKSCNVCVKSHRMLTPDTSLTKEVL